MKHWFLIALLLLPLPAAAFSAIVIKIADGDTFTAVRDGRKLHVRIFGIDAPEHDQPGGTVASNDLATLILGKTVEIEPPPRHRSFPKSYNRIVAVVRLADGQDAGLALLTLGDAWAYDHYRPPRSYDEAMTQAAGLRLGLWSAASPEAPWDWRRDHHIGHYR